MLYYLVVGLSVKFVTVFGHLAAVPLMKKGRFRHPLSYQGSGHLPEREGRLCRFEQGKANLNSGLRNAWYSQQVWGSRGDFQLIFLLHQEPQSFGSNDCDDLISLLEFAVDKFAGRQFAGRQFAG
jgi:hypothetical protein